ncbi:MAG TPA: ACT domain-containing protein [Clostridiales bacterium]|nr:ACT domain-containing protein [Clostridiales bacterium]
MRAVITVVGKDKIGIIAGVSTLLAEHQINILDISQTILQDFFTMVMVVDLAKTDVSFEVLKSTLARKGEEMGLSIKIQHEDIFNAMHQI